jgi:hypothetical protein
MATLTSGRRALTLLTLHAEQLCAGIFISGVCWYLLNACVAASVALNWNIQLCFPDEL